jgi:hypothetical protein
MRNAGFTVGVVMFLIALLAGVFNAQLCAPCVALVGGAAAGYLASQWRRPSTSGMAARQGAMAGAAAGVGALLGHLVGGLVGAARIGMEAAAAQVNELMRSMGLPPLQTELNPVTYYVSAAATSVCFGVFEIALMAAVGALGGVLWYQMTGSKAAPSATAG